MRFWAWHDRHIGQSHYSRLAIGDIKTTVIQQQQQQRSCFPHNQSLPSNSLKLCYIYNYCGKEREGYYSKGSTLPFCANQRNQSKLDLYLLCLLALRSHYALSTWWNPPSSSSWTAAGPISCVRERVRRFHFVFIESLMAIWNVCLVLCVFPYTTRWYTRKFISSTPFWGLVPGPWWVCFTREKLSSIYTVIEKISI